MVSPQMGRDIAGAQIRLLKRLVRLDSVQLPKAFSMAISSMPSGTLFREPFKMLPAAPTGLPSKSFPNVLPASHRLPEISSVLSAKSAACSSDDNLLRIVSSTFSGLDCSSIRSTE